MFAAQIYALTLGQSLLTASLLFMRVRHSNVYLPLAFFFLVNALAEFCFILRELNGLDGILLYSVEIELVKLLVELMLPPLFWIYVRELTSEYAVGKRAKDLVHFVFPLAPSLVLALAIHWFAPNSNASSSSYIVTLTAVLNLAALAQFCFYVLLVMRRLKAYRRRLMNLFASTKSMELNWFRGALLLILVSISLEVIAELLRAVYGMENPFKPWNSSLRLALVWFFSVWGLRQRPDLMIEVAITHERLSPELKKYEKSRVDEPQLMQIAEKIRVAVEDECIYREPTLSLRMLAEHINVLPSYVSQALNIQIKESFFDYINRHRVAETMIHLQESDETVLDIASAAGFNSRSSFYTAFKKVAKKTPTEYRKASMLKPLPKDK